MSFTKISQYEEKTDSCFFPTSPVKDHMHITLKKLLADMRNSNFDGIKFATYRTAAKLLYIQRFTNLHLVDIYNIIEAFRENGMNTGYQNAEIDEARLECIIASIFIALHKRLPASNEIDVECNIVSLTKWLMHAFDRSKAGRIRTLSVKVALTALCSGRMIDKLRYVFTQISDPNGLLNQSKFDGYLKEVLTLPASVGEEPNFTYNEGTYKEFFQPAGVLEVKGTSMDTFLQSLMIEKTSGVLFWMHMLDKLMKSSLVLHEVQCKACNRKPFAGLRYKCLECHNYQLCQDCFWREKTTGSHSISHDMREFSSWNKGEKGISVKKRLLCSPSATGNRLPDYPKEPEPIKTLDMSNIVPAVPADVSSFALNSSINSILNDSSNANNLSCFKSLDDTEVSQESVKRMDDEHRLIVRYAQRLASETEEEPEPSVLAISFGGEITKEQRAMISSLEDQNRSLLLEIQRLKVEHEQTVRITQQAGSDGNVITELKILRQRKDELEMRMSALQETRRELMVQLEGLMKLLKNNQTSPRDVTKALSFRDMPVSAKTLQSPYSTQGHSTQGSLIGVNGDVKQAFGKTDNGGKDINLRDDLLHTVDDITSVFSVLVEELSQEEQEVLVETPNGLPSLSSNRKYELLARDLDLIMNELSVTQANQDLVEVRNPVIFADR